MKPGGFQGKKFPFTPKRRKKSPGSQCNNIFLYLGLVLRDPCGLGNPFLPQKTGEDI